MLLARQLLFGQHHTHIAVESVGLPPPHGVLPSSALPYPTSVQAPMAHTRIWLLLRAANDALMATIPALQQKVAAVSQGPALVPLNPNGAARAASTGAANSGAQACVRALMRSHEPQLVIVGCVPHQRFGRTTC